MNFQLIYKFTDTGICINLYSFVPLNIYSAQFPKCSSDRVATGLNLQFALMLSPTSNLSD